MNLELLNLLYQAENLATFGTVREHFTLRIGIRRFLPTALPLQGEDWVQTLITAIYAFSTGMCVLAAVAALGARHYLRLRYLAYFLLLEAGVFLMEGLLYQPSEAYSALMFALMMMLSLFIAPCLWLLFEESVSDSQKHFSYSLTHRERQLISLGCVLCLPLLSLELTWNWLQGPGKPYEPLYGGLIHLAMVGAVAIFVFQVPHFYRRCQRRIATCNSLSGPDAQRLAALHPMLNLLLLLLVTKWVIVIGRTLQCWFLPSNEWVAQLMPLLELISMPITLVILAWRSSRLGKLPRVLPASLSATYQNSALTHMDMDRIGGKLSQASGNQSLICDSRLSLARLSQQLGEPSYYVTQVLNQKLKCNFYDFVNQARIGFARQLLHHQPQCSILDIAYQVGFNSKSTFNTAFKRYTGLTPSEFREQKGKRQTGLVMTTRNG